MISLLLRLQLNRPLKCADGLLELPLAKLTPAQKVVDFTASQAFSRQLTERLLRLGIAARLILYPSDGVTERSFVRIRGLEGKKQ